MEDSVCVCAKELHCECLGGVNWCLFSFYVSACVGIFRANPISLVLCLIYISHSTQLLSDSMKQASARCWPVQRTQHQNNNRTGLWQSVRFLFSLQMQHLLSLFHTYTQPASILLLIKLFNPWKVYQPDLIRKYHYFMSWRLWLFLMKVHPQPLGKPNPHWDINKSYEKCEWDHTNSYKFAKT